MDAKQMKIVATIAKKGSFSAAGEELFLSRQAIMKHVNQMEQELGFAIFDRSACGVSTTSVGAKFLAEMEALQRQYQRMVDGCRQEVKRQESLRIELPRHPNTLLDRIIEAFSEQYPQVQLNISLESSQGRIDRLWSGKIDVAELPYHEGILKPGMEYHPLVKNRYMCLMSEKHPLARSKKIHPDQLLFYQVYVFGLKNRQELVDCLHEQVPGLTLQEIPGDEMEGILNVCYNNGIYITPAYFAEHLERVAAVPLDCDIAQEIGIVSMKNPNKTVENFIRVAEEMYRNKLVKLHNGYKCKIDTTA
jgi:molybdate transport repressor ModE-like protein